MNPVFLTITHLNRDRYVKAISVLLLFMSFSIFSQSSDTPYDFPTKPGTPEWAKFQSHEDMINGCQIPEDILKIMSTKALVKTCITYPLFGDIIGSSDIQFRFGHMVSNFNGLKELLQRSDVAEAALQEYIDMSDLDSQEANSINEKWRFMYLEILLSQPAIIDNLSIIKKKRLMHEAVKKYSAKSNQPEIYGSHELAPSCLIMSRLMNGKVKSGKKELDSRISNFDKITFLVDSETINAIVGAAEKYLHN
jgi:hypothetical protein